MPLQARRECMGHDVFVCPAQKLYMEVRRAVRQLYVKSSAPGSSGGEWCHALDGGARREPASQGSLPGPCGGQSLHLHPKQAEDDALQPHLPKACTHSPHLAGGT